MAPKVNNRSLLVVCTLLVMLALHQHSSSAASLSPSSSASSEADVGQSALEVVQQQQQQHRFRRAASGADLALLQNQQLLEDEQAMKRQLPELIAQARNDRNIERALLKMLISAASLSRPSGGGGAWQQELGEPVAEGGVPRMSARLEQVIDRLAGAGELATSSDPYATSSAAIDKREYYKPCLFNAVSCARNPFRRI